jgi:hypothetical protein
MRTITICRTTLWELKTRWEEPIISWWLTTKKAWAQLTRGLTFRLIRMLMETRLVSIARELCRRNRWTRLRTDTIKSDQTTQWARMNATNSAKRLPLRALLMESIHSLRISRWKKSRLLWDMLTLMEATQEWDKTVLVLSMQEIP